MQKFYYPVCSTKEEFNRDWKIDSLHGDTQSYGFHDGWDINLKTGGSTDLGRPLYGVLPFKRKYYHYNSHLTSGFGRHILNEVVAPFDNKTYWLHFAHMEEGGPELSEGSHDTVVGTIGATGRPRGQMSPHLHFSIFKKLPEKIDMIATSRKLLDEYWVDPEWFFEQLENTSEPMITIPARERDELIKRSSILTDLENAGYPHLQAVNAVIMSMKESQKDIKKEYDEFVLKIVEKLNPTGSIAPVTDKNYAMKLIEEMIGENDQIRHELKKITEKFNEEKQALERENSQLEKDIESLRQDISDMKTKHQLQIETLTDEHNVEIEKLEKRIDQVINDAERNKEKREDSEKIGNFFIELFNKFFKK